MSASGPRIRRQLHLFAMVVAMVLLIWLSSGTLAPYGATLDHPLVLEPCHYLANVDHHQFFATFAMLDRRPADEWNDSVVLRRILYPVLAYPFMKLLSLDGNDERGFLVGGFCATILLHIVAFVVFLRFLRKRYGERAAAIGGWLLVTYPGVTYWAGLPYSYVAIVPLSLLGLILLVRIDESDSAEGLLRDSLLLGVLFTGYDLLPFFGPASFLLVLKKRSVRMSVTNAAAMLLPSGLVGAIFLYLPQLPANNSNTAIYGTVIRAWLDHPPGWGALIARLPEVTLSNFLFGNFVFLPLAFAIAALWRHREHEAFERAELALLGSVAAVFLFNNAAPPYGGWQVRGDWIARLYQPVFVVYVAFLARWGVRAAWRKWLIAGVIALNASTIVGPLFLSPVSARIYNRFYRHSAEESMLRNLRRFGRRPLGFCLHSHANDPTGPVPDEPLRRDIYVPWEPPK